MVIADQTDERTMSCLKRRDSEMDCTHCVLQSTVCSQVSRKSASSAASSSDNSIAPRPSRRHCSKNNAGKRETHFPPERNTSITVKHHLGVAVHGRQRSLSSQQLGATRHHLVQYSANDFPPVLSSFDSLGSLPWNLYKNLSFDTLHAVDLGVTRLFCDMTHIALRRGSSQAPSLLIRTETEWWNAMIPSTSLFTHRSFCLNHSDTKGGIFAKNRRQLVLLIWVSLMGLNDAFYDDEELVRTVTQLTVENNYLWTSVLQMAKIVIQF